MSVTKHTPGPWKVEPHDLSDKWIRIIDPGVHVDYDDVCHDEQDANAHLIAAAPDLLDACEALVGCFDDGDITWSQTEARIALLVDTVVRAAIAKARGAP